MLKQTLRYLLALSVVCALLSCKSPFDPSTSEGADILNELDPTIADFTTAFRVIDTVTTIGSTTSQRRLFAWNNAAVVGELNGERSFGYVDFDSLFTLAAANANVIDSVQIIFQLDPSIDTTRIPDSYNVSVYRMTERNGTTIPLNTRDTSSYKDSLPLGTLTFSKTQKADTLTLDIALVRLNFVPKSHVEVVPVGDSTRADTAKTAYIIMPYPAYCLIPEFEGTLLKFTSPALHVYYKIPVEDTTHALFESKNAARISYSVFETTPTQLDTLPRLSYASGRCAIIALDMGPFWESVTAPDHGRIFSVINSCYLQLPFDTGALRSEDTSAIQIRYHLLDSMPDTTDLSNVLVSSYKQEKGWSTSLPDGRLNLNILPDANAIYQSGLRPQTCYLVMSLDSPGTNKGWRWMEWKFSSSDLVIQATVSNPR